MMKWSNLTQSYEFETGMIFGTINPFSNYHGVSGLMHVDHKINVVRPANSFLNAEYYLRPDSGLIMIPRSLSKEQKVSHSLKDKKTVLYFPAEPQYNLRMTLTYAANEDYIDMKTAILPNMDIPAFEVFFASYICENFDETWVCLNNNKNDLEEWIKLDNRKTINISFRVFRNQYIKEQSLDGRFGKNAAERWKTAIIENRFFKYPLLAARESRTGFSLIFLLDTEKTTCLAGQYHGWDTAHDWSFGADLRKGMMMTASCRMVYRYFSTKEDMLNKCIHLWNEFIK